MSSKNIEKVYEVSFHLVPTLGESGVQSEFESIKKFMASKGEICGIDEPQVMELAYTIRHKIRGEDGTYDRFVEAYFCSVKYVSTTENVQAVKDALQENENVLRFIIVETNKEDTRAPVEKEEEKNDESQRTRKQGA